jgi:hypothetical protein
MKKAILIIAILSLSIGFSQTKSDVQNKVLEAYKVAFNNDDYIGIYNLHSEMFQSKTNVNRIKVYSERLKKASGKMLKINALNSPKDGFESFMATFKKKNKVYKMMVKFNSENQIDYLSFNTKL